MARISTTIFPAAAASSRVARWLRLRELGPAQYLQSLARQRLAEGI
ncbi:MAG: hypothetical protein L0387_17900 [Acidobacteria bacterium]|nr:hypothetical protein [Acidobacteriota bacterium]MCI0623505.1 hypothetical protein [Acidobacteriota bacterium]MCI0720854.1 hypothetical protein [Acidobacteriota bacterium]